MYLERDFMTLRIVYPSALEYWLEEKGVPRGVNIFDATDAFLPGKKGVRQQVRELSFKNPVHIAVPKKMNRVKDEEIICHAMSKQVSPDSLRQLADGVFISSPEMCFLQAARDLPIHQLVQLANNLCAIYVVDPYEDYGQRRREPVTSVDEIKKFLLKQQRYLNLKRARIAINYALDHSNSPMETNLATLALLPWRYGGYNLKAPKLNLDVNLSETGADHLGRDTVCCDMVWVDEKVVLEYDSNLAHLSPSQHAMDKKRATALALSGYTVICVTAQDIRNFSAIENLFMRIRAALGMQTFKKSVTDNFEQRYDVVHDIIFPKSR